MQRCLSLQSGDGTVVYKKISRFLWGDFIFWVKSPQQIFFWLHADVQLSPLFALLFVGSTTTEVAMS